MPRRPNRRQFDPSAGQKYVPLWLLSASPSTAPGATFIEVTFSGPVTIPGGIAAEIIGQAYLVGTDVTPNPFISPCTLLTLLSAVIVRFTFGEELDPSLFWEICVPTQWPALIGETGGTIGGSNPPELSGVDPPAPLAWAILATPPP